MAAGITWFGEVTVWLDGSVGTELTVDDPAGGLVELTAADHPIGGAGRVDAVGVVVGPLVSGGGRLAPL